MKISNEILNLVFTGISSTCALIVTLLAIWAAFFTSLPEKLISEFRTDIKYTKEELIDLKNEKRLIEEENKLILQENDKLKSINESMHNSIQSLESDYTSLKKETKKYKEKENSILKRQYNLYVMNLISRLKNIFYENKIKSLYLSNIEITYKWIQSEPEMFIRKGNKLINNYEKYKIWRNNKPYDPGFLGFSTVIDLNLVTSANQTIESHKEFINKELIKDEYSTFLSTIRYAAKTLKPEDNKKSERYNLFIKRLNEYLKNNENSLNFYIEPVIYSSSTNDELIKSGKLNLEALEKAKLLAKSLDAALMKYYD